MLGKLADEVGLDHIERLDDLVPLLFAHSNYKSYPEGFIAKGRWDLMNKWIDTLSTMKVAGIDVEGVTDQDVWVDRLHTVGQKAYVTSGTTGKNSFLPQTQSDEDLSLKMLIRSVQRQPLFADGERRPIFIFGPKHGHHRAALHFRTLVETFGRPDASYFLTEEPMRIAEITRMGDLRKRIADGTAMPSEIAAFERETAASRRRTRRGSTSSWTRSSSTATSPCTSSASGRSTGSIVERARARGVQAGEFHPDTVITGGGGTKGAVMPPDYEEQILHFFGISPDHVTGGYGMSEVSTALGEVDGRYRPAPWVVPLAARRHRREADRPGHRSGRWPVRVLRRVARGSLGGCDHRRPRDGRLRHADANGRRREHRALQRARKAATTSSPARARSTPT